MIHIDFVSFISYLFLALTCISGVGMLLKNNPVHAVLCLIGAFFSGAGLLLINNAEFVAFVVLTVYVGAVMVLFLFVVMMIDVDKIQFIQNTWRERLSTLGLGCVLFGFLFSAIKEELLIKHDAIKFATEQSMLASENINQAKIFGQILYNPEFSLVLIIASLILFVAIVGVITLTLREKTDLKKQNLFTQLLRSKKDTLELKKVTSGAGVDDE